MMVFPSCIHLVESRNEFQIFKIQIFCMRSWARHIWYFIWEPVSWWFVWHFWGHQISSPKTSKVWCCDRHNASGHLSTRSEAILSKNLAFEWRDLRNLMSQLQCPYGCKSKVPATFKRSLAMPMYTWAGDCHDRSPLAIQGKVTRIVKLAARIRARVMWEIVWWFICCFWYFWRVCEQ